MDVGRASSHTSRRTLVLGGVGALALGSTVGGTMLWRSRHADVPLLSETVAVESTGSAVAVAPGDAATVLPGTRVLRRAPGAAALAVDEQRWLDSGSAWTHSAGTTGDLARGALLDLRALTLPSGLPVAGWAPAWRYVWPRDCAHVAAALAATGHVDEALPSLRFLARVQAANGSFEARYLPDGSGPPDHRAGQLDGVGWALWATARVMDALPPDRAAALLRELRPMIDRATDLALSSTRDGHALPPASPDYWEVAETAVTLGTVAPLAAGLHCAATLYERLGEVDRQRQSADAAAASTELLMERFGAQGFPRHLGADDPDAAIAFVGPPYGPDVPATTAAVARALPGSEIRMRRPAGGVAPGASWKDDGTSWTPETALLALAYAGSGRPADARRMLGWLAEHRTAAGSLPEKVLHDGRPAAVAPLGWTASLVLLTLARLEHADG